MTGLPEPRANPLLIGHRAAEAEMLAAMRGARMHHAWLITGPQGLGKATLAFRFARRILAGAPAVDAVDLALPETHATFRRVAAGSHADLLTIEREWDDKRKRLRGEIVVGDVRRVSAFLHLTSAEGGWRVVVLDGAEDLNRNAANALLKMLEEPPARAVLLLTCAAPGRLLPTLRSRCRRLRLAALSEPDMDVLLARALPDMAEARRARVRALAEGSPGQALRLAQAEGVDVAETVERVLGRLPGLTVTHAAETAAALGRDEDAFSAFMDLLRARLSLAVRDAARGVADGEQARMLGGRPLAGWVDVWHALTTLQRETEDLHLDKRQSLATSFGMLARGAP